MGASLVTPDQLKKVGFIEAVSTVSTTNITLSGFQTLNGQLGVDGDRIMVTGQTVATEDGIYIARTGAWDRADDAAADGLDDLGSSLFKVEDGTFSGQLWQVDNKRGVGVVGTDQLTISEHTGATTDTEVYEEDVSYTPGTFVATLANTPTVFKGVFVNGIRQREGGSNDYTRSGVTLTFTKKLKTNDVVLADYNH
jgi:hypothetical protein